MRSSTPQGQRKPRGRHPLPPTPKAFGAHGTHRVRDQLVARCREIRELETVDEAEAKGTRLLALEGQTARQGFSPSLLFAAAIDARPPPSRGYALNRWPTSVEGSSIDGPRSPERREAQNHGATPIPDGRCKAHRLSNKSTSAVPSHCADEAAWAGRARFTSTGSCQTRCQQTTPPRIGCCLNVRVSRETAAPGGTGIGGTTSSVNQ